MVFWKSKRLAKEFHLSTLTVSRILLSLGAKRWSRNSYSNTGPVYFWEG